MKVAQNIDDEASHVEGDYDFDVEEFDEDKSLDD